MREVKFRAFYKKIGEILEVEAVFLHKLKRYAILRKDDEETLKVNLCDIVLLQYTGLKDKNGVKIYEGDIIGEVVHGRVTVGEVEYIDSGTFNVLGYALRLSPKKEDIVYIYSDDNLEVIGNIYENPELLEAQNER